MSAERRGGSWEPPPAEGGATRRRGPVGTLARGLAAVLVIGFMALLAYGVTSQAPDTTIDDALSRAEPVPAPGFRLVVLARGSVPPASAATTREAMADGTVDLGELRGAPVVLNFWASWCIPCREEARLLQRGWERDGRRGVLFVGLNQQDIREDARGFLREFGQTFPQIRDPDKTTARRWGVTGIPETFFVRRDGRIVGHVIGVVSPRQLEQGVTAAITGRPVGAQVGGSQRPTR